MVVYLSFSFIFVSLKYDAVIDVCTMGCFICNWSFRYPKTFIFKRICWTLWYVPHIFWSNIDWRKTQCNFFFNLHKVCPMFVYYIIRKSVTCVVRKLTHNFNLEHHNYYFEYSEMSNILSNACIFPIYFLGGSLWF